MKQTPAVHLFETGNGLRVDEGSGVLQVSAATGHGMDAWYPWIRPGRQMTPAGHATI